MAICIGFPDSSLRGFRTACAGRAADGSAVVARVRRGTRCVSLLSASGPVIAGDLCILFKVFGTRKSRYSGRKAAAVTLLNALDE
jgi:hypothetical protein